MVLRILLAIFWGGSGFWGAPLASIYPELSHSVHVAAFMIIV